ncbi:MAG: tRNA (adenosine(37)-N6)-threonylcarbamoyltransferase complex dimerization subunit type 1 TsaB [Ilumatobacteraceae bacterium]
MITLAIETATQVVGVALAGDDGILGSVEINRGRRHGEVLAPAIEFVCRHAQVAVGEIGAIGVDVGPGLFTGMRVGIATAKTIAQALQVAVVGVSSLDLLAHQLRFGAKVIASVIDARKGEVFYSFYVPDGVGPEGCVPHRGGPGGGGVRRLTEPKAGSVAELNADVLARGQDVVAVGDGAWRYRDDIEPSVEIAALAHPSAIALVHLARAQAARAGFDPSPDLVQPMYLRAPDAQINWARR